jgi:hypothetical protein
MRALVRPGGEQSTAGAAGKVDPLFADRTWRHFTDRRRASMYVIKRQQMCLSKHAIQPTRSY